jgi:hypothetical protein
MCRLLEVSARVGGETGGSHAGLGAAAPGSRLATAISRMARISTYVEFFRVYWRSRGFSRNLTGNFLHKGGLQPFSGTAFMKVFVFDLLAYGEQLDHLKVGSELPYPLSNRYFKADVAVRTYAEHLEAWEEMDRLGYDGVGFNEHHCSPYGLMNFRI